MSVFRICALTLFMALSLGAFGDASADEGGDYEETITQLERTLGSSVELEDYPEETAAVDAMLDRTIEVYRTVAPVRDAALTFASGAVAGEDLVVLSRDFYTATPELKATVVGIIGPEHFDDEGNPDDAAIIIIIIIIIIILLLIPTKAY